MTRSVITTVRQWLLLAGSGLTVAACIIIGAGYANLTLFGIIRWPGDGTLIVIAFITISILLVALAININFMVKNGDVVTPEPEAVSPVPQVGSDLDRIIENRLLAPHLPAEERHRIRERLRQTAIHTIQRTAGVSRPQAAELITQGEWTGNTTAAAFLGETELPRSLRLCDHVLSQLVFRHSVRQTARAIVTYGNENTGR